MTAMMTISRTGRVPMKATGINTQLSHISPTSDDSIALQPYPFMLSACRSFILRKTLSFAKSPMT